jgi:hypothetical protein
MFKGYSFPGLTPFLERAALALDVGPAELPRLRDNVQLRRVGQQIASSTSWSDDKLDDIMGHAHKERDLIAVALLAAEMMLDEAHDQHGTVPPETPFIFRPRFDDGPKMGQGPIDAGEKVIRKGTTGPILLVTSCSPDTGRLLCENPSKEGDTAEWIAADELARPGQTTEDNLPEGVGLFREAIRDPHSGFIRPRHSLREGSTVVNNEPGGALGHLTEAPRTEHARLDNGRRPVIEEGELSGEAEDVGPKGDGPRRGRNGRGRGSGQKRPDGGPLGDAGRPGDDRQTGPKSVVEGGGPPAEGAPAGDGGDAQGGGGGLLPTGVPPLEGPDPGGVASGP